MRSTIRAVRLALIVTAALAATTTTASAHEFVASKTGALTGTFTGAEWLSEPGGVSGSCTKATLSGSVTALKSKVLFVKTAYSGCQFFGLGVHPLTVEYEVSAEGKVSPVAAFTMESTLGCSWKWTPVKTEESVVKFTNSGPVKTVSAARSSKNMHEEGSGGFCGEGKATEALWTETSSLGVEGGTLQWK